MLNKVILIGNLGKDPVFRVTANHSPVAEFSLATTESWKEGGERFTHTEWHKVIVWGKLAEAVRDGLHKGSKAYIEGSLRTRKWTDKDGIDRYTVEVKASRVLFLDSKKKRDDNDAALPDGDSQGPVDDNDIPF